MSAKKAKKRQTFRLVLLIVIFVPFAFYFTVNALKISSLEKKKAELEGLIETQKANTLFLEDELSKVGTPAYYEYMARKLLGYIYPFEKIIVRSPEELPVLSPSVTPPAQVTP